MRRGTSTTGRQQIQIGPHGRGQAVEQRPADERVADRHLVEMRQLPEAY